MASFGLIIFGDYLHLAGSAADTDQDFDVNPEGLRIDLSIFDNPALVAFSKDGRNFSAPRELPAGVLSSLDIRVRKFRIRNKTAGSIARYDLTAYFDPILIQGREYVRAL